MSLTVPAQTLIDALYDGASRHGKNTIIGKDALTGGTLTYKALFKACGALGSSLSRLTKHGEHVGVFMPTATPTIALFYALQSIGRVPAMLNVTAGASDLIAACNMGRLHIVVTSRRFIEMAELQDKIGALSQHTEILYLEDVKDALKLTDKLAALKTLFVKPGPDRQPHDPAVILFTSGSEGKPKGVALSHTNLITNIEQLKRRVAFTTADSFFNCLPMFHSFGMLVGVVLPPLCGVGNILYPSPLHYKAVPDAIRKHKPTLMVSTDTFLNGYAKMADKDDFQSVRAIFAGAEKLKEPTRLLYQEQFNTTIYQGYGVTETSPVLAVNTDGQHKPGTIGKLLEGIEHRLEPVEGIAEGSRLFVCGPNIMLGYLKNNGGITPPVDGWHDTGDIVSIDADGYVTIQGRAKRFAKIAGEMVSLTVVEQLAQAAYPDAVHAAITRSDPQRGEQIVLFSQELDASREKLVAQAQKDKVSELAVPKKFVNIAAIPVLGTGKTDYVTLATQLTHD